MDYDKYIGSEIHYLKFIGKTRSDHRYEYIPVKVNEIDYVIKRKGSSSEEQIEKIEFLNEDNVRYNAGAKWFDTKEKMIETALDLKYEVIQRIV